MHRILKQTVELTVAPELDALAVQDRLSRACRGGELLELDRLFDRLAGDRVLRIGRMELDLGDISGDIGGDDWLPEFSRRLAQCAEQTLTRAADGTQAAEFSSDGRQSSGSVESLTELRPGRERFEVLATLLRHGRLPWWSDPPTERDWVRAECATLTSGDRRELIALAADNPRVLQRLVIQLPATAIGQLIGSELPTGLAGRLVTAAATIESQLALPSPRVSEWQTVYWQPLFRYLRAGTARLEPKTVVTHWLTRLSALQPGSLERLQARLEPAMPVPTLPQAWQQAFTEALHQVATGIDPAACAARQTPGAVAPEASPKTPSPRPGDCGQPVQQTQPPPTPSSDAGPHEAGTPIAATPTAHTPAGPRPPPDPATATILPPRSTTNRPAPSAPDTAVDLDVSAAGMVLLHPFLGELFTQLELLDQGQFIDRDRRQIAVQLLGYLAGAQRPTEPELTLAKLLCGMDLDEVLVPLDLDTATRAAADALLAAVLKHWTALKSSSADWLREQFILRGGRLRVVDAGWRLTVEGRAQDVLLARLPWGFGVISLPWMDGMLHVNWGD